MLFNAVARNNFVTCRVCVASNVHVNLLIVPKDDLYANDFAESHHLDLLDLDHNPILFRSKRKIQRDNDFQETIPDANSTSSGHDKSQRAETTDRCTEGQLSSNPTLVKLSGTSIGSIACNDEESDMEWCVATRFRTNFDVDYAERPLRVMLAVVGGISLKDCASELRWTKTHAWQVIHFSDACVHS